MKKGQASPYKYFVICIVVCIVFLMVFLPSVFYITFKCVFGPVDYYITEQVDIYVPEYVVRIGVSNNEY